MGSIQEATAWSQPKKTPSEAIGLFTALEKKYPSSTLGDEKWYIMTIAALTGGGQPECAETLYKYLIKKPQYSSSESRKALIRRLREALVKCVSIVGVCKPLEAIFCIDKIESPEDKDYTCSREDWQCDAANDERGFRWQNRLYLQNQAGIDNALAAHRDFDWLSKKITYGLYLSDHTILDDVDTEMVVLSGIMIQNLTSETHWHLRGTRRIGVSMKDVESIQQCIEMIAEFCGLRLDRVPRVADVESEV